MKTAIIWGADGGIGQALVQQLKTDKWTVVGFGRHVERFEDEVDFAYEADVANQFGVQTAVHQAALEIDKANLFIYTVGNIVHQKSPDMSPEAWTQVINANLNGAFYTYHHSRPFLTDDAHIFFLGAVTERLQLPGFAPYVAAKAGLEAFAATLKKEERKKKITVVRPGAVATPFWEKLPITLPKDAAPADKVAAKIMEAFAEGKAGQLDLV